MENLLVYLNYLEHRNEMDVVNLSLGLASIVTNAKTKEPIKILDCVLPNLSYEQSYEKIKEEKPIVVGFYTTMINLMPALNICHKLKFDYNKNIITVIGGPGARSLTFLSKKSNIDCIDYVVCGDGEKDFEKICNSKLKPKKTIYLDDIVSLASLNFPRRECFDVQGYIKHSKEKTFWKAKELYLYLSKGCNYGKCIFCSVKGKVRLRPLHQVKEELSYLKNFGIEQLSIFDPNFLCDLDYAKSFCNIIKPYKLKWRTEASIKDIIKDESILNNMEASGCSYLAVGIESGSDKMLRVLKKGITISEIKKALEKISKTNISLFPLFIYNIPYETETDLNSSYILLKNIFNKKIKVARIIFSEFAPLPATPAFTKGLYGSMSKEEKERFKNKVKNLCENNKVPCFFINFTPINLAQIITHVKEV
ncbi:MAG: radical SAM protein [Candidatus Nanoarchaeia archaeon]